MKDIARDYWAGLAFGGVGADCGVPLGRGERVGPDDGCDGMAATEGRERAQGLQDQLLPICG